MITLNDALWILENVAALMLLGFVYSLLGHLVKCLSDLWLPQFPLENPEGADQTSDDDSDPDIFLYCFERTLERTRRETGVAE
ncbi:hypothetical protein PENSTE_c010G04624 [Penicillium steckii]|uniref:Uncharacterized protein n=1 Tax=Penicillium steckii TaxID=303698 RepID=A0A1V6T7E1_9EURO|nr:hypothetical protein PENSTE_c010G04624 [Penicillium steckii]